MGWELRKGGRRYYYRGARVGGRVVKQYLGAGPAAEAAAAEDAARREKAHAARRARRAERERFEQVAVLVQELSLGVGQLLESALATAGYHRHHRGEWRRRRGQVQS